MGQKKKKSRSKSNKHSSPAHSPENKLKSPAGTNAKASREEASTGNGADSQAQQSEKGEQNKLGPPPNLKTTEKVVPELKSANNNSTDVPVKKASSEAKSPEGKEGNKTPPPAQTGFNFLLSLLGQQQKGPPAEEEAGVSETPISREEDETPDGHEVPDVVVATDERNSLQENQVEPQAAEQTEAGDEEKVSTDFSERSSPQPVGSNASGAETIEEVSDASLNKIAVTTASGIHSLAVADTMEVAASPVSEERTPSHNQEDHERRDDIPSTAYPELGGDDRDATLQIGAQTDYVAEASDGGVPPSEEDLVTGAKDQGAAKEMNIGQDDHEAGASEEQKDSESSTARPTSWLYGGHHAAGYGVEEPQTEIRGSSFLGAMRNSVAEGPQPPPPRNAWGGYDEWNDPAQAYGSEGAYDDEADGSGFEDRDRSDRASPWAAMKTEEAKPTVFRDNVTEASAKPGVPLPELAKTVTGSNGPVKTKPRKPAPRVSWDMPIERFHEKVNGSVDPVRSTKELTASLPAEPSEKKVGLAEVVEPIESNATPEPVTVKATDPVQDSLLNMGVDHTAKDSAPTERPLTNTTADKDRTAVKTHEVQSRNVVDHSKKAALPVSKVADDKNTLSKVQRKTTNVAASNSAPKQVVPVKRPKSSVAPTTKSKPSQKKVSFADPAEEADPLEFSQAGSTMNETELKKILRMVDVEEPIESDMEALVGMENSLRAALKRQRDLGDAAAAKDDLIETLREQLEIATNRYESMSERVTRTETELKNRAEAMSQMQNQLKENAAELSKAKRGAMISKEEYTSLQQNVKRRGETVAELERDIEVKEALLKSMRLDLSMLQKQNGEVGTRLSTRETEKGRLQSELAAERQEVKRLGGIIENFGEMKATIEASQRESWRADPQLESKLREAQKTNAAMQWELKVLRFQMQATPTSSRREPMLQKMPAEQLQYSWSTEELETLQRLKERQLNPGSKAKESGLEEPFVSHSEMSRRCFPGDSAKYLEAFSKLYRVGSIGDKLIDDLKGACMAINPVDWERIYLSFFMALESMGKQTSSGEREKLDALWYQRPWQSVIADDLSNCTETTFQNWTARIWGLGFRNILLWGEPKESLIEQLTQSGFTLCVEGTSVASTSQDSPFSKLAMEGDDFARSVLFENTDQWSEVDTAGAFLRTTGRKCFDLNMSTFGAWQQSFSTVVEELRSGKVMGKCISLGNLKFGSVNRTAAAPECEALCFLLGTLAARKGAIIVADLPVSLHSESLKWRSAGNVLILSRLLQVQTFNSVMGGNVHPLLQCLAELSRARIPWISGLEVPLVESKDILRNEGFVNRLTFGDKTKFAAIVEGAEEKNACAAFLTMLVAGIPMMQSGSDLTREAKFVQSRTKREKEVGFGNGDELLNLFRVDFSAAADEQSEPVKKIVGDLNVAVKNIYESSEALRFVNVSVQEVGEDQSMVCFVRTMPQASTEPIPVVVLANTSDRPVSGRIEASDMLVKLQVPNVAFKLDHLCEPTEGAKFDSSFGVLAAELPPYAISCFRLRVAQTPQRTKMMLSSTLSTPELKANTVPVLFDWNEGGNSAVVTGSFLNWKQVVALFPVKSNPRRHVGLHYMRPGTYEAKFISDGVWVCSPGLPLTNPSLTPADPSANNQLVVQTPKHDTEVVELHNHFMAVSRARRLPVEMGNMPCLRPVVIAWTRGGSSVSMSASFSGWNDVYKMFAHEAGRYHWTIINFPIGSHYYRFYVDGQWTVAEEHPIQVDDKGIRSNFIQIS
ncbi:hypothetical protein NDN08_003549 [Rhodosorus marinus]|uniref:AMP-activated protein kinase glycogen-binding domain-containing protein n=1 Tax=Rhodosorus marinus TaxID=101924 RepID=A0AAV8UZP8_9RHOD|nr:hypothetical protein NDN08_003549 [Rhodosorus marinus]